MNKIIAIVGMCGTGKSEVTKMLVQWGFSVLYFGGVVTEKVREKGLALTQENERPIREDLRKKYGMAAIAIVSYPQIESLLEKGNVVIDGLYSWSEYKFLKEKLGEDLIVVSVISDKSVRYQRLKTRPIRPLTEIKALTRDETEIETLEKGGPIAMADYYIYNNKKIEDMKEKVLQILKNIGIEVG